MQLTSEKKTTTAIAVALGLMMPFGGIFAQTVGATPPTAALKRLSLEELMDIEVTSVSKRPEKLSGTASAIQVVTGDDIRRSGASNLPQALRLAGNLNVAAQNSRDWNISARGFNTDLANKLLVLIDGRTVYTPLFSGVFWNTQDYLLEDIDRIEVISGPGGALWGANAVNGVINIITKSARDTTGLFVEAAAGNHLDFQAGARYGGVAAPGIHFRLYGKYSEHDNGVLASGAAAISSWRMSRGGFRVDADGSAGNTFTWQGDFYHGTEDAAVGPNKIRGANLLGRWSHVSAGDSNLSLQAYCDWSHLASPKPAAFAAPAGILVDDLTTYDLDFQHHLAQGGRHRFSWGLGFRFIHDVVDNSPTVGFLPPRLDHKLFSGFVQDEITLGEKLRVTLGTKVERTDYTGYELEPSARWNFELSPGHMLWGAVSRAVRTPSRIDRDLIQRTGLAPPLPAALFAGGPDFVSETLVAYELGYRGQLGTKASASLALFYNDYDHVRSFTGTPPFGFPLVTHNNVEGQTHGLEFSATYRVSDRWRLHGTYNLLKEHLRVKPGQVDFSNALNETADPQQQFSVRSLLNLGRNVELDAMLRWVDTLHNNNGPNPGTVPDYFELDARLGWHPTSSLELSLVGQNLLDDHHPEYGFSGPNREEVRRSVHAKLTWRF